MTERGAVESVEEGDEFVEQGVVFFEPGGPLEQRREAPARRGAFARDEQSAEQAARAHPLRLDKIRAAVRFVERKLGVPQPLARQAFKTDGVELFVEHLGRLLNVSRDGQLAIREAFGARLERVEYESGLAARLFPLVRRASGEQPRIVVIDPLRAFGRPVLCGTGIPVATIQERFKGGDSSADLARDCGVGVEAVEEALRAA